MAKTIDQKFADFKERNHLSNAKIIKMATEYANSDAECSMSYFATKYGISKSAFQKARDYAIICCLLDEKTYEKIKKKSSMNYKANNPNHKADGSIKHFDVLKNLRKEYFESFTEEDIRNIARKYAEGISVSKIAISYDTGEYAIKRLLHKGIVNLIVDKETTEEIYNRLGSLIDNMIVERTKNKQLLISCIESEIATVNFQIANYSLYFSNIQNKPTLKTLQDRLTMFEKRRQLIKKL